MSEVLIAGVLLAVATGFARELPSGQFLYYSFSFVGFAAFLVVGPAAAAVVVAAGAVGAAAARLLRRGHARSALMTGVAIAAGIAAGHLAARAVGAGYPVALGESADLLRFLAIMLAAFCVFGAAKRGLERVGDAGARGGLAIFAIGLVFGAPIQLAAHAAYVHGSTAAWAAALVWSFLIDAVIAAEVARMRRNVELVEELAVKERLAAIGQVTARIVHQTRHQLGLIGMIAHQLERRTRGLPDDDARAVREQLDRLEAVHEDLSRMLTLDGAGARGDGPERDYASVVRRQAARLEPLATSRGVRLRLQIEPTARAPVDPDTFGQGVFNVLENAIAAARGEVAVALTAADGGLAIEVTDDGSGIPSELIGRATQPFVTTKPGGTGMGLAIARSVVEGEGGELTLQNRPEGGLRVRMHLRGPGTRGRAG